MTLSTTEVEYMSTRHACKKVWLKRLPDELGVKQEGIVHDCDGQNVLHLEKKAYISPKD